MIEFERPEPRHPELTEYYNNITACAFRSSTVPKIERLLAGTPFAHDITIELLDKKGLLPTDNYHYDDPSIATDWLTILPIVAIGSELEQSTYPVEQVAGWYEDAARHIQAVATENGHGDECYEHYYDMYICDRSDICPLRFIEGELSDDIVRRNQTDAIVVDDEIRRNLLVGMKLAAGYNAGIFKYHSYKLMLKNHEAKINIRSDSAAN